VSKHFKYALYSLIIIRLTINNAVQKKLK